MKILQVNVVYKKGSTGKIAADIHTELKKQGHRSVVCYSRAHPSDGEDAIMLCGTFYSHINAALSRVTGIMYGGCFFSTSKLLSIIKKEKPDVVHLQCLNGYFVNIYRLLNWLKKRHITTVITLHAEFMYTGGCGYSIDCHQWKNHNGCGYSGCPRWRSETRSIFFDRTNMMWRKMKEAIDGFSELQVVAVSDWLAKRAKESPVFEKIDVKRIHNGIDLSVFQPADEEKKSAVRKKYNIPEDKQIVIYVTPRYNDEIKGGKYFTELIKKIPDNYQSVIVGCNEAIPEKAIGISFVDNQIELAALYSIADVFVITSKVDNYPTVCIEANCCGTPIVGFDVGGVRETIGNGMGETVAPYDIDKLAEKVVYWSGKKAEITTELLQKRREYCDKKRMTEDYLRLYHSILC